MSEPIASEPGYSLVMPFVACRSQGGPYDDQAFSAGYHAGLIDKSLEVAAIAGADELRLTARSALTPQLDLIAMRWGFSLVHQPCPEAHGWSYCTFTSMGDVA